MVLDLIGNNRTSNEYIIKIIDRLKNVMPDIKTKIIDFNKPDNFKFPTGSRIYFRHRTGRATYSIGILLNDNSPEVRDEDKYCWQFSNKGYFNFKSNIPKILSQFKLN